MTSGQLDPFIFLLVFRYMDAMEPVFRSVYSKNTEKFYPMTLDLEKSASQMISRSINT